MYVTKRKGVYQFRKPIPKQIQALFGRDDLRRSLRTTSARVAHRRAWEMSDGLDDVFDILRKIKATDNATAMAMEAIEACLKTGQSPTAAFKDSVQQIEASMATLRAMGPAETGRSSGGGLSSGDLARLESILAQRVSDAVLEAHKSRYCAENLSVEIAAYKQNLRLNGKHAEDVPRRLDFFLDVVGDMACRDLRRTHIEAFRDLIDQLPQKWQQRYRGDDKATALKAIALNDKRLKKFPLLDPSTIKLKYIGPVGRFVASLALSDKIEKDFSEGIESKRTANSQNAVAPQQRRLPFKIGQLNAILAEASTRSKVRAVYWTPVVMLFTGARLNEICQLRTDDLVQHNGRLHLSILCLDDEDANSDAETTSGGNAREADERRIKSAAGRRLIPIHPKLIELGFLDFVGTRRGKNGTHGQLFREIEPDKHGYFSGGPSKSLNRLIRKVKAAGPLRSVYSFRHNFADECKSAKMPVETKQKLMGHQLPGVTGIYGNPKPLPHESEWIDKIAYDGVDFSPYRRRNS